MYVSSGECGIKPEYVADRPRDFKFIHGPCSETSHHTYTPKLPPCCDLSLVLHGGTLEGKIQ